MSAVDHMKGFWDARARENAEYYVDNRLDYTHGDAAFFWEQGVRDLDALLDAAGAVLAPTDAVLDIGVGVGRIAKPLAARVETVTGIDISSEMIERARRNLAADGVRLLVGDGTSLAGVADASQDAVVSLVVFQHIPDPRITLAYVREIGRVLKPGGWAAFQVSTDPAVHTRPYGRPPAWKRLLGRAPRGQSDPAWRGSAVDLDELRAAVTDGGMRVAHSVGEGTQACILRCVKDA